MLGDSSAKALLQLLGYMYPGYMCFKDVQNGNSDKLRLWTMYWVLMAAFTAVQPITDTFLFFLPFYYTAKVALAVYLWWDNMAGAELVYTRYAVPFVLQYEPLVDSKIAEVKSLVTSVVHSNFAVFVQWLQQKVLAALSHTGNGLRAEPAGQAAPAAYRSGSGTSMDRSFSSFRSASSGGISLRSFSVKSTD